jgi:flagellar biogenesis protein FliO
MMNNYFSGMFQLLFILALFGAGSYFLMRKMKKKQLRMTSENHMIQVVDGVQMGMNQNLYLVKVGTEMVLMSSGSSGVSMIKLEQTEIKDPKEQFDELFQKETSPTQWLKSNTMSLIGRWKKNE